MSKLQYLLGTLSLLIVLCNGLPVVPKEPEVEEEGLLDEEDTGLEYDRYLRQVIKVLEKDPDMRKRMEELSLEDLKEGNFARELGFLSANIRSKLDELKRVEVGRLRTVARQRMEAQMAPGSKKMDPKEIENWVGHVDPANMGSFTDQDFERLIKKAAADLDEADKERKKEFKRYEMEKELQRRQQLKEMDEANRGKAEEEFKRRKEKIKNHPKIKHPASKAQMQDVWEETDHLDRDDFNPKTFFALHDTNGDRKLDMFELEALFIKEVEKIYKDKDGDPREKFEEMSRMREHVLREIDLDGDKMVSKEEFLKAADQAQFEDDEGWKDINQEDQFTEDELQDYNKMVQERLERKKLRMQNINKKEGLNINQGNVQMNQQVNQPPPPGGDPKLRVNQPPQPPVNQQVPQVNVNQAAAQQVAAQQAAQQAAAQQAAQLAAAQARAAQQAAAQQGQVQPQQGQQQGGVPQQQQLNQQQQQQMIEEQKQHQLKLEQEQLRLQQEAQAQQEFNAQQQQLNAQQQAQINAQKQAQINAQQQQQLNAQQQQQQQVNAQQQQNQQQQQQPIQVQEGQGQPIQGQPPAMPPQGQAQGQPPQGGAPGQPPAQPAQ